MFIEKDCIFEVQGKKFESGGAFICDCTDGITRGVVYEKAKEGIVTDWHGKEIAKAKFGKVYQGNFCRMQSVRFEYEGKTFTGRFCPDWSQLIRVKANKGRGICPG